MRIRQPVEPLLGRGFFGGRDRYHKRRAVRSHGFPARTSRSRVSRAAGVGAGPAMLAPIGTWGTSVRARDVSGNERDGAGPRICWDKPGACDHKLPGALTLKRCGWSTTSYAGLNTSGWWCGDVGFMTGVSLCEGMLRIECGALWPVR
ncbi:hypothetical protein EJ06DRAFT_345178 [Trichodelitschia bisporula]|uniref:Uncharacterized protein n=1 Tax=Trichodelitschia bisporula TaxID=703511 RepID=A0A6G1I3A3_9PEZI|nr:hypothetical protein EJ06DRAFT_345178 [Trichodelitschia bisporula]